VITPELLLCWIAFSWHNECWEIAGMMLTGSEMPWRKKGSGPAFQDENLAENQLNTTRENTKDATASRWRDRRALD